MSRHHLLFLSCAFALLLSPSQTAAQEGDDRLTTDLYLEWERVSAEAQKSWYVKLTESFIRLGKYISGGEKDV